MTTQTTTTRKTYLVSVLSGAAFDAARTMFDDEIQNDIAEILHHKLFESYEAAHAAGLTGEYGEYERTEPVYEDDSDEPEIWYAYREDGENVLARITA